MLSRTEWLKLAKPTRQKIAILLGIPRSNGTVVEGDRVMSDGYTDRDLATLTLEKLQEFMGDKSENFYELFNQLVKNVELPPVEIKLNPKKK